MQFIELYCVAFNLNGFHFIAKMHHTVLYSDVKNDCFGYHIWFRGYNSNFSRYGRIDFHILPSKISLGKPESDFFSWQSGIANFKADWLAGAAYGGNMH